MSFIEVADRVVELLRTRGRITYRALKREFNVDDEFIEDLKEELIEGQELAVDKEGRVLVWTGGETPQERVSHTADAPAQSPQPDRETPAGERRQLTVMFCDLVGSTALSERLDPEELQTVVRTYQDVSAQAIERYEGYIAQYLGDGLLVYFGYPAAHEDDAARAIRAGLEIVTALDKARHQFPEPVQVRIGIHTGPVVVGQMGGGSRHEQLALGETPNIAARVQDQAAPDEVVISAATLRLVAGLFETQDRGLHELKGISTPQPLYRVTTESAAQSRFEVAVQAGLTPLVGRENELVVLRERWTQAQAGNGQVVLVSGEPGIGKSRLVQELKSQATQAGATSITFLCSPYHQNSALYPIIEHLQRLLRFRTDETTEARLAKVQQMLGRYRFPQADTLSLLAALLSLPHPAGVSPLSMSPQKQKELTHAALVAWLLEEAEQQVVYNAWEDLHWADPSTLEVLELLVSQVPTTRLLAVLTFRPEFVPPWGMHSYLSQLTLSRLSQPQVSTMVERVTGGKALPEEVVQQIVTKTDGVPLFVEELSKMVVESSLVREVDSHYELSGPLPSLAIPSTLRDSLMARLDRLATVLDIAQLGATIGREFSYDLLRSISPLEETVLQHGLRQLVDTEFLYQRGVPPQARYTFKHALIQDTAYQSLLKSTRQQYHHQIAEVLEQQFPEVAKTQPEVVAQHYTEAGLAEQAISYWQKAGQNAVERSTHAEAIHHLTKGLDLLSALPATPERTRHELMLQISLGPSLAASKGFTAPEVGQSYTRARELCQQLGETPQLFPVRFGLWLFYILRADLQTAGDLAAQLLRQAEKTPSTDFLTEAHRAQGITLVERGVFGASRQHLERSVTFYDPHEHQAHVFLYSHDPKVASLNYLAWALWFLGYPDQAVQQAEESLTWARHSAHPFSLAFALTFAAVVHLFRREHPVAQQYAEEAVALCTDQGFPYYLAVGLVAGGRALPVRELGGAGRTQLRQGITASRATGTELLCVQWLTFLAETCCEGGHSEEGLAAVQEALASAGRTGESFCEAELYRVKGELTLQSQSNNPEQKREEAVACFHKAMAVARQQQAKSWELRAATSLARLWQQQGKRAEARNLLTPVYDWFTEGFDTKDLKDAKALLEEMS